PRHLRSWHGFLLRILLVVLAIAFYVPAGTALLVAFLPIMTVEAGRLWKAGQRPSRSLLYTLVALLLLAAVVPVLRNTVRGAIRFPIEAGKTNAIAHGLMWEGI